MSFENKLWRMIERVDREAQRQLKSSIKDFATNVALILKTQAWSDIPVAKERILAEAAHDALSAAKQLDASDYLRQKVLCADSGRILDVKLKQGLRDAQDQITLLFETKQAPPRGFVYVAWSGRPEKFLYVGKAGNARRLNLTQHGKLARATAHSTTLSLLFPTQSRAEILSGVEGSLLRTVKACTGSLPRLNDKNGRVPAGAGTKRLHELGDFLLNVGDDFSRNS